MSSRPKVIHLECLASNSIMNALLQRWRNTQDLPRLLKVLCQGTMVASPVLLLFLVVPLFDWTVNGRKISYGELWASGAGLAFLLALSLASIGSWGVASRNPRARWALVLVPIAPIAALSVWPSTWLTSQLSYSDLWLNSLFTAALILWGLFGVQSVNKYFASHGTPRSGA